MGYTEYDSEFQGSPIIAPIIFLGLIGIILIYIIYLIQTKKVCFKCKKNVYDFSKKFYFYHGNRKGSLDITEEQVMCEKCFFEKYPDFDKDTPHNKKIMQYSHKTFLLFHKAKFKEALKQLSQVFDKTNEANWHTKGSILTNLGKYKEALKCYDEAIFLNTHYVKAWYRKGVLIYLCKERYENNLRDAIQCFNNVITLEADREISNVRDDWYWAAKFHLLLASILLNNLLLKRKTPDLKLNDEVKELIYQICDVTNSSFEFKAYPFHRGFEKGDTNIKQYAKYKLLPDVSNWEDLRVKWVDACFLNYQKLVEFFEPPIIFQAYSLGARKHKDIKDSVIIER